MSVRLTRKQALGIKTETTQGTPATISTATDFLLCDSIELTVPTERLARNYFRPSLDKLKSITGRRSVQVKFVCELKGSGTAGTATVAGFAALAAAWEACGYTLATVPATSITFAPTSDPYSASFFGPGRSCTLEVYKDGLKHVVAGCVGDVKGTTTVGGYPGLEFTLMGTYSAATDVAVPSPTIVDVDPVAWENQSVSLMGDSTIVFDKFEWGPGNTAFQRDDPKVATAVLGFVLTDRDPKGTCDIEAELVAGFDAFGKLIANTEASTSIAFNGGAGNTVTLTFPKTQIEGVQYGDQGGIMTYSLALKFNQNTGDDWMSCVIT